MKSCIPRFCAACLPAVFVYPIAALGQQPFTNEALARGINYTTTQNNYGVGVAFNDLDDDGDPDVALIGASNNQVGLYENLGTGYFADRTSGSGVPLVSLASAIVAGDYNGDGLLDLYITRNGGANYLLKNTGGFQFEDVTINAGVGDSGPGMGAAFGDYDGDGRLDLYLANYSTSVGTRNRLYHNLGGGVFDEVGAAMGVDSQGYSFQPIFFDYDLDGDVDLYLSNDRAGHNLMIPNQLWRNDGGAFTDVSTSSGANSNGFYMGVACGDFDRNGWPDLYSTNIASVPNTLLLNQGNGQFNETAPAAGVQSFRTGWGTLFFDYNNNQQSELYVCNQFSGGVGSPANRHYANTGGYPCTDIAAALNVNNGGYSYAVATADVDNDGDLDMLVQAWNEPMRLNINREGTSRNWLKIKLLASGPNRHAIGATIRVTTAEVTQMRQIIDGIGYKSSSSLVAHFGLDGFTFANELVVTWPGGEYTTTLTNINANQTITIVDCQSALRGDFTGDGFITTDDLPPFIESLLAPMPMGDCVGDKNEDGQFNGLDIGAMVDAMI